MNCQEINGSTLSNGVSFTLRGSSNMLPLLTARNQQHNSLVQQDYFTCISFACVWKYLCTHHPSVKRFVSAEDKFKSRMNTHKSSNFCSVNAVLCINRADENVIETFVLLHFNSKKNTIVVILIAKGQVNTFGQLIMVAKWWRNNELGLDKEFFLLVRPMAHVPTIVILRIRCVKYAANSYSTYIHRYSYVSN